MPERRRERRREQKQPDKRQEARQEKSTKFVVAAKDLAATPAEIEEIKQRTS